MSGGIAALLPVTEAALAALQADMARLAQEEATLRRRLADLDAGATVELPLEDNAFLRAGADPAWQAWVAARRRAIGMELARLRVRQADARARLSVASGRREAVATLALRERARRRQLLDRRAGT